MAIRTSGSSCSQLGVPARIPASRFLPSKVSLYLEHKTARFDPNAFFAKPSSERSVGQYRSRDVAFAQGDAADSVFYILKGKVKLSVVSSRGKEAVIAIAEAAVLR